MKKYVTILGLTAVFLLVAGCDKHHSYRDLATKPAPADTVFVPTPHDSLPPCPPPHKKHGR